jgi:hypothetical protein
MSEAFTVRIEWLDAPGVSTPELAATWARYEIWVGGRCVTQVEESDGTFRRSVYGSLYPLAEWAASNWWVLGHDVRPSAVESRYWTWQSVRTQPWLVQHNLRGAGDGMAWPNLTLVPEGDVTRAVWVPDRDRSVSQVRFVSVGDAWARSDEVSEGLARLVDHVLDRLVEADLPESRLSEEWAAVAGADDEEGAFCRAVARLGLDPYAVDDETAADVLHVAGTLPEELVGDFLDNADPRVLRHAADWTRHAVGAATRAGQGRVESTGNASADVRSNIGGFIGSTGERRAAVGDRISYGAIGPAGAGGAKRRSVRHFSMGGKGYVQPKLRRHPRSCGSCAGPVRPVPGQQPDPLRPGESAGPRVDPPSSALIHTVDGPRL